MEVYMNTQNALDVVCLGNSVADVITHTVDEIPPTGTLVYKDSIELYSGGCALSSAIDMARLGIKSALIAKFGKDSFGDFLRSVALKDGVDIEGVKSSDMPTSASVALVNSQGERTFLHCPGANADFTDTDIDWDIIARTKYVFAGGIMIMPGFDGEPCARVFKRCREMGKITVLDTAWDSTARWMEKLESSLPYTDLFMPSVEEAEKLSGKKSLDEMADVFFAHGVKQVVIKTGKNGCYLREARDAAPVYLSTYSHIKPVCTTGAGDSFCAGFLTALVKGMSFVEAGRFANAVGTHCIMRTGATAGIVTYEQTLKFMAENEQYLR